MATDAPGRLSRPPVSLYVVLPVVGLGFLIVFDPLDAIMGAALALAVGAWMRSQALDWRLVAYAAAFASISATVTGGSGAALVLVLLLWISAKAQTGWPFVAGFVGLFSALPGGDVLFAACLALWTGMPDGSGSFARPPILVLSGTMIGAVAGLLFADPWWLAPVALLAGGAAHMVARYPGNAEIGRVTSKAAGVVALLPAAGLGVFAALGRHVPLAGVDAAYIGWASVAIGVLLFALGIGLDVFAHGRPQLVFMNYCVALFGGIVVALLATTGELGAALVAVIVVWPSLVFAISVGYRRLEMSVSGLASWGVLAAAIVLVVAANGARLLR